MTVRSFFGGLLIAVGFIVMLLSGACSIMAIFGGLFSVGSAWDFLMMFASGSIAILIFGGIPFLIGFGLYKAGRKISGVPTYRYVPSDSNDDEAEDDATENLQAPRGDEP